MQGKELGKSLRGDKATLFRSAYVATYSAKTLAQQTHRTAPDHRHRPSIRQQDNARMNKY
jgi:hypothetical protein